MRRWRGSATRLAVAFVEITDLDLEHGGEGIELCRGNPVLTRLVLEDLLVGHAHAIAQLLLGQAEHVAAVAYPPADVAIDLFGLPARLRGTGGRDGVGAHDPRSVLTGGNVDRSPGTDGLSADSPTAVPWHLAAVYPADASSSIV